MFYLKKIKAMNDLTNMASQTIWEGGEAVISARIILNMEVDDMNAGLRGGLITNDEQFITQNIFSTTLLNEKIMQLKQLGYAHFILLDALGKQINVDVNSNLNFLAKGLYQLIGIDNKGMNMRIKFIQE